MFPDEPVGTVYHRHYKITAHAISRYAERIGGDVWDLISDLDSCWIFDVDRKGMKRNLCAAVAKRERKGGYALCNDRVMFLIQPGRHYAVLTTLAMNQGAER
ncbi:hypothetical protein LB105_002513 [Salmonella enterica]|uniref:Uncharacterized protein n=1 Tax=Salmonella newport TaxID=108619 RepID=A0A5X8XZC4_SALNE|nr:hypothetical protein [Salmonella enterica]EBS4087001.1 hypothetical protein [Salmonella enterica subsp. enterica serovar Newport]EBW8393187.1 hypothetical protein [Salmonella enterica subsp. enterica serovar Florida]ECC9938694.1 hypothetical protein [Salmonella enterica subsp. enterica]ECJ2420679.1 hypothetical protein [Salmonella enterica subsp. diarizonae]